MGIRISSEIIKNKLQVENYVLLGEYKNSYSHSELQCPKGHVFKTKLNNFFFRYSRCPICAKNKQARIQKIPFETVALEAQKCNFTILSTKEEYESNHHKKGAIKISCSCGTIRNINWETLKKHKKCQICTNKNTNQNKKLTIQQISNKCKLNGYKLISTTYKNNKQKLDILCKKHGLFESRLNDIDQGHGCPSCGHINSNLEQEVKDFIKTIYDGEIQYNNRKILNGLEIDIWIPSLRVAIEFDGLYWHSEAVKNKPHLTNIRKIREIQSKNIKFLAIFEDEWKDPVKREIIKSMISSKLGLIKEKVYARNTTTFVVGKQEALKFMNDNHLDGHVQFSKAIGLRNDKGQLIMCITIRTSRKREMEIARMASLIFTNVIGGASKLISNIVGPIVSYSNNRIGDGNVYKQLGFIEKTLTNSPSYYYTDFKKRVWRFKCRKLQDISLGSTEREQAVNGCFSKHFGHSKPVYRIYDYGHKRWVKE